ncbi:MAG TPA: RsmE family RNA methyltransferase [Candidatus Binataceae bacterium]|jgi:16S rRNA (uracil1498-N3)-methyltransferase|nr:RsmE family RNA methyltransferase [Candidatus Binataceae bacterium]
MSSTPPRFAISSANVRGNEAHLAGAELHHLRDVLRLRPGDAVGLVDERGRNLSGRIALIDAAAALIRIERVQEPRGAPPLILALAIIKGPRMDLAVEKAAELGASEVWPLICARCVVRDPGAQRLARWRRLAAAACKQSLASRQVEIKAPLNFGDLLPRVPKGILPVICQAGAPPLALALGRATRSGILIACGPEGDFTPDEVAAAQQMGFVSASLGRNRLRTETAALAALAIAAPILEQLAQAD